MSKKRVKIGKYFKFQGCSIEPDPRVTEARMSCGLVRGHAYSITKAIRADIQTPKVKGKMAVKMNFLRVDFDRCVNFCLQESCPPQLILYSFEYDLTMLPFLLLSYLKQRQLLTKFSAAKLKIANKNLFRQNSSDPNPESLGQRNRMERTLV